MNDEIKEALLFQPVVLGKHQIWRFSQTKPRWFVDWRIILFVKNEKVGICVRSDYGHPQARLYIPQEVNVPTDSGDDTSSAQPESSLWSAPVSLPFYKAEEMLACAEFLRYDFGEWWVDATSDPKDVNSISKILARFSTYRDVVVGRERVIWIPKN